jgi:hypothetical protein
MSETSAPSSGATQTSPIVNGVVVVEPFPPTTVRRQSKRKGIPRLKKWQVVLITWTDAVSLDGAQDSNTEFKCVTRHSAGHFIRRSKEAITIAMEDDRSVDESSDCDSVTVLPLSMVKKVTILTPLL